MRGIWLLRSLTHCWDCDLKNNIERDIYISNAVNISSIGLEKINTNTKSF